MDRKPELIVMLTYDDMTVNNAAELFELCKNTKAVNWGIKEEPLPVCEMKKLFDYMKQCGKKTSLEVVAYEEHECLKGAVTALECGCDVLMGTKFFDSVNDLCKKNGMKYMPFVGNVSNRPSILEGKPEDIIDEAKRYIQKGAYGIDLLGYRYVGDQKDLIKKVVSALDAPVCVAGSVNSFERIDEILEASPSLFTIGSAFINHSFGDDITDQINAVCDYIEAYR